jgi:hypothetical protein
MKTKLRQTILSFTLFAVLLAAPSCALLRPDSTVAEKARAVQQLAYAASAIGSASALEQKPEWRPAFELAYTNLNSLVESGTISGQTLRNILATLPVRELESRTARIAVDSASLLFDTITGKPVDLAEAPLVLAAAKGIRDGLRVGLGK